MRYLTRIVVFVLLWMDTVRLLRACHTVHMDKLVNRRERKNSKSGIDVVASAIVMAVTEAKVSEKPSWLHNHWLNSCVVPINDSKVKIHFFSSLILHNNFWYNFFFSMALRYCVCYLPLYMCMFVLVFFWRVFHFNSNAESKEQTLSWWFILKSNVESY